MNVDNNMHAPKFFPVIHLRDDVQGHREADKAFDAGADGVFFINHFGDDAMAVRLATETKRKRNDWYVGINLLASGPVVAFEQAITARLDGVWADAVGVDSTGLNGKAQDLRQLHVRYPAIDIFAGVAFKYQAEDANPMGTVHQLNNLGWIPCTSGASTGTAAEVNKVANLGNVSSTGLGLASGVTLDNVADYLPYVSHFFIASSISHDDYTFDFECMSAMAGRIHRRG